VIEESEEAHHVSAALAFYFGSTYFTQRVIWDQNGSHVLDHSLSED
jgi:hypothetical protein